MKKLSLSTASAYFFEAVIILWTCFLYYDEKLSYQEAFAVLAVSGIFFMIAGIVCRYLSCGALKALKLSKEQRRKYAKYKKAYYRIGGTFFFTILIVSFVALCRRITM